jgi:steroid delta-isomerase-like uncharacterized protein
MGIGSNRLDEFIGTDFVDHDLLGLSGDVHGVEGKRQFIQMLQSAFANLHFTIEDLVAEEGKVVIWWTMRGRHSGEFIDIPPSNNDVQVTGMEILRVAGGRFREQWTVVDVLGWLRQLGVAPDLETLAK